MPMWGVLLLTLLVLHNGPRNSYIGNFPFLLFCNQKISGGWDGKMLHMVLKQETLMGAWKRVLPLQAKKCKMIAKEGFWD